VLSKSARPAQLLLILVVYVLGAKAGAVLLAGRAAGVPAPTALVAGALVLLPAAASTAARRSGSPGGVRERH
jgi:hypothetical protein